MERLPYIDEHSTVIAATSERVWDALTWVLGAGLGRSLPAPLVRGMALAPSGRRGEWRGTPALGDALPGFAVQEVRPRERLALRGRHRFSNYALTFDLDPAGEGGCTLRAQTWAEFPGMTGRAYRALVIGSGGHRLVVRRLLRRVAARA